MSLDMGYSTVQSIAGARIIDPASGFDDEGVIVFERGHITEMGKSVLPRGETIDGRGLIASPGLIDMRVMSGEPGRESKETLLTAGRAAAAGGITSFVVMPDTRPIIDDVSLVDYISRRGTQDAGVNVYVAGALTKSLDGHTLTEIGLMSEAGAVMFSNGTTPIADAQIMRRLLSYSATFNALIANRAIDPALSAGSCAHESDMSSRLGLTASPAIAERLMVERDLALAELTGGRLLIDLISSKEALPPIKRAKARDLDIAVSVSINHLCLSDHDPHPAGEKRLPYAEAAAGAVGLDILLGAGLSQVADNKLDLMAFLKAVTFNPANLLGLPSGRLTPEAPADIILLDPNKPWLCNEDSLLSKSKNTPFDGRRMTGRCVRTIVGGETVFDSSS